MTIRNWRQTESTSRLAAEIGDKLLRLDASDVSRHIDELTDAAEPTTGYGDWSAAVFLSLIDHLRSREERRTIAWVISLPVSAELQVKRIDLADVTAGASPATVYLLTGEQIFDDVFEEYRRQIQTSDIPSNLMVMFRSWRDEQSAASGWPYNNAIYLWSASPDQSGKVVQ